MSGAKRSGKMIDYINHMIRVTLKDGRELAGQMLAFDKHTNLVIADCEEFRRVKKKSTKTGALTTETEKRTLGLVILRGAEMVALAIEGPPPAAPSARLGTTAPGGPTAAPAAMAAGPGASRPAGRGLPPGLTGPAAGVGGPGPGLGGFGPAFLPPPFAGRGGPPGPPGAFGGGGGYPGALGGPQIYPPGYVPGPPSGPPGGPPGGRGFPPQGFR